MNFKALSKTVLGVFLVSVVMIAHAAPDLVVGEVAGNVGDTVTVPITFTNDDAVVGMDFKLKYNPALLTVSSVDLSGLGGSISNHSNDAKNGVITFLFANFPLEEISSGEVLVKFIINEATSSEATSSLALKKVTFSNKAADAIVAGKVIGGSVAIKTADTTTSVTPSSTKSGSGAFSLWDFFFLSLLLLFVNNRYHKT